MSNITIDVFFETCWTPCKKPHLSSWSRLRFTFFWSTPYFTDLYALFNEILPWIQDLLILQPEFVVIHVELKTLYRIGHWGIVNKENNLNPISLLTRRLTVFCPKLGYLNHRLKWSLTCASNARRVTRGSSMSICWIIKLSETSSSTVKVPSGNFKPYSIIV